MIYLDNNATTPADPAVIEAMLPFLRDQFANPSASYGPARAVHRAVDLARDQVAALLGADAGEVVFTSGGTEASNAVITSARQRWPGRRHLIVGATEHPAVLEPARRWQEEGGRVTRVPVDRLGVVDLDALRAALAEGDVALVSMMWANNETGVIAPVEAVAQMAHEAGVLFHTDAVQAVGKIPTDVRQVPVDFLSLSAHKLHGPKGAGALYVSKRVRFQPSVLGGGQESGRRSGTENVPGIVGLGRAVAVVKAQEGDLVKGLRDAFEQQVLGAIQGAAINGHPDLRLPGTSNLYLPGVDAAGMLILLDQRKLYCSAGSACHTAQLHPSPVLEAMGYDAHHAAQSLRFSFSRFNTMAEAQTAAQLVIDMALKMRSLTEGGPVVVQS